MLEPVELSPVAQEQHRVLCQKYRRAREALDGAFRTIGYRGATIPFVPGTHLRVQETRGTPDMPAFALFFVINDGVFWVERIVEI